MAFINTAPYPQGANTKQVEVLAANANTPVDVFVAPAGNFSVCTDILVSTDDTAAQTIQLIIHDGTIGYVFGTVTLPATSGTGAGVPPVNMMSVFNPANSLSNSLIYTDENGNRQLMLKASEKIQFNILAMTAAKKCHIRSFGRDF